MKRRAQVQRTWSGPLLPTGHHCPESGWWTPGMTGGETRYITEGTVMPTAGGLPAVWTKATGPNSPGAGAESP